MQTNSSSTPAEILLVEDSPVEAEILRRILVKAGHTVRQAKNGADGLQALRERPSALVISDIQMPLMNGYELCKEIKHDEKLWNIPVILVSTLSESKDILNALIVGADGYLTKPCSESILLGRIDSLLAIPIHRKRSEEQRVEQIVHNGTRHAITADSRQLLNLLLSVYENTLSQNQELVKIQSQLNVLNDSLEDQVQERTSALRASEEKLQKITSSAQDAIIMMGLDQSILFWNESAERIFGYSAAEALGSDLHSIVAPMDLRKRFTRAFPNFKASGDGPLIGKLTEFVAKRKNGEEFPVELSISRVILNGQWHAIGIVRDISERKKAAAELEHTSRALAAISAVNRQLVYATDENDLLKTICQVIVERGGYRMAWVGYTQHDENKSVKVMAHAGQEVGYLEDIRITWAEAERGMGPTGRAIRSGTTQLCSDFTTDPRNLPWRDAALKNGYAASIALPLADNGGEIFGTLTVYANEVNAFTRPEVVLLEEMAGDLAFGVRTLRLRQELVLSMTTSQRYFMELQDSLEDTVQAIAGIVELRDPYTAGHQARVGELAEAIARQIGLSDEQVQGVHLASIMHDLGKIKIPAEILCKPGRLTDIEYSLVKTHSQSGFEILKNIRFHYPLAQVVLQHHERLDGTGYPQGLKGDAIMLEARILAVADVVESMSSHRPYRPGLGTEAALEEITKQRGTGLDPQVVDACLTLFRDKGFTFKI